jgi:RND family efflux transporter MFP subunit
MHTELENQVDIAGRSPRSARRFGLLGLLFVLVLMGLFAAGYLPRHRRQAELVAEASESASRSRRVNVVAVRRSSSDAETTLPGNIQAIEETPIYARADGYVRRRLVDIGDRVQPGQLLAEIETPELDQQIRQARAANEQSRAAALQARAALAQAQANFKLADANLKRWRPLVAKGVLSQQEGDQKQSDFDAQQANVRAGEAAVAAADSNVQAGEANLQRLLELKSFSKVAAPFAGVITSRNIDVGTLISSGSGTTTRQLFNLARIDRLRIYINVPQTFAPSVRVGQQADVVLQELAGKVFRGTVTRTANALDPSTHTLLTEVQVPNQARQLFPGMYAQVKFTVARVAPPLLIPGDALIVKPDGSYALVVDEAGAVHYRKVTLGRDYGTAVELTSGLNGAEHVIVNPTDDLKEGEVVSATLR